MQVEKKIADMDLALVPPTPGVANLVPTARAGNLLFVAGHIPRMPDGSVLHVGKVGREITVEQGYEAARQAALNCLGSIKEALGDLDKVKRIAKLLVMVNAADDFNRHFVVGNGASDLLVELYGDRGKHARSAVGMGSLPRGSCVEVEMVLEVED